jgi:cyclic pyranopterin phosphate synthase
VVPAREVVARIAAEWPVEPVTPNYFGEVAERWRYRDGAGEFGVISSVTQPFCGSCTRARLTADGKLYLCLFATEGHDLLRLIRHRASDEELMDAIRSAWSVRDDRYSEIRSAETVGLQRVEMSRIGG